MPSSDFILGGTQPFVTLRFSSIYNYLHSLFVAIVLRVDYVTYNST